MFWKNLHFYSKNYNIRFSNHLIIYFNILFWIVFWKAIQAPIYYDKHFKCQIFKIIQSNFFLVQMISLTSRIIIKNLIMTLVKNQGYIYDYRLLK